MLRYALVSILLMTILGAGAWKFLDNRIASALAVQHTKHLSKITQIRRSHAKEVARLKQKHRKTITRVKARARAKAKVQRAVSAVPIMGIAAFGLFEKLEFEEWKKDHPNGTFESYLAEVSDEVNRLLRDEYHEYSDEYAHLIDIWSEEN